MNFDWRAFDAYLFDIDGTLLNCRDAVHYHAFNAALASVYGCKTTIDKVPVHGNTDVGILRATTQLEGISEQDFQQKLPAVLREICDLVEKNRAELKPELCPTIQVILEGLRRDQKIVGIVTGNLESVGWIKLQAVGIAGFFEFGSFSDRHHTRVEVFRNGADLVCARRPGASICFVGDTPSDISAARQLGMPVIAVATGIFSCEQLNDYSPDICISSFKDLL